MTLKMLDIYNEVANQPWSMFDGDVGSGDEFDSNLRSAIQKAVEELWTAYNYSFRIKELDFNTVLSRKTYDTPIGNIRKKKVDGSLRYCVRITGGNYLDFIDDYEMLEEKSGIPEGFYIKNDKICLYPVPDAVYPINVEYFTLAVGKDLYDDPIFTLENDTDEIDVSEKYEKLFKKAVVNLSMCNAIASDTDENYTNYYRQYKNAYNSLIKCSTFPTESRTSW